MAPTQTEQVKFPHRIPVTKTTFTSKYDWDYIPEPGDGLELKDINNAGYDRNRPMVTNLGGTDGWKSQQHATHNGDHRAPRGLPMSTAHARHGGFWPAGGEPVNSTAKDTFNKAALEGFLPPPPRGPQGAAARYDPDFLKHDAVDTPRKEPEPVPFALPKRQVRDRLNFLEGPFAPDGTTNRAYGDHPYGGPGQSWPDDKSAAALADEYRRRGAGPPDQYPDKYNPVKISRANLPRQGVSRRHECEGHVYQSTMSASYHNMGNMPEREGGGPVDKKEYPFQHKDLVDFRPAAHLSKAFADGGLVAEKPEGVHDSTWKLLATQTAKTLREDPHGHKKREAADGYAASTTMGSTTGRVTGGYSLPRLTNRGEASVTFK